MLILLLLLGQIRVYFQPDSIHKRLINRIDSAQYSIDICFYKIHDGPGIPPSPGSQVIDALLSAWERNVKIRVITDDENLSYLGRLRQVGISVISDSGLRGYSYTMHNKFAVFDYRDSSLQTPAWVWTGSYNASEDIHADNAIEIQSESLAYLYTLEFNQMWGGDVDTIIRDTSRLRFHRRKSNILPYRSVSVGPYEIRLFFSPQDSTLDSIFRETSNADSSINFCLYAFSITYPKGKDLADTLIKRWREDKQIGGVFCGSLTNNNWSAYPYLRDSGLLVYRDRVIFGNSLLHHKFAILDQKKVITGSMNWSESGNRENDENTLIITGPKGNPVALAYDSEFVRRFQEAGYDVSVTTIVSPKGVIDSGTTVTPACSVYNRGIRDTSYWLQMKVGAIYTRLYYVDNHPARTYLHLQLPSFPCTLPRGWHQASCSTRLRIDTDRSNDKNIDSFFIRVRDVGVVSLLAPAGTIDSLTAVTPACSVYNFGTTTEGPYLVRMKIGDFYNYTAEVSTHNPGERLYLEFPPLSNWPRGTHPVTCSTELSGDLNPNNDKMTSEVSVRVSDVGSLVITSPPNSVDSGMVITPACTVYNYGNSTESYSVRFKIGNFYNETTFVSNHNPEEKVYLTFPEWSVNQRGNWTFSCSTELADDLNPTNDKRIGNVSVLVRDVGVIALLLPDTFSAGEPLTPACSVYNFGSISETYTCRLKIADFYDQRLSVLNHPPFQGLEITFPQVLPPPGMHIVRCSTELSGDLVPENNILIDSFYVPSVGLKETMAEKISRPYLKVRPSPFRNSTSLSFALPPNSLGRIEIYNTCGELLKSFAVSGSRTLLWQGRDEKGRILPKGVYFYRLTAGDFKTTTKALKIE